MKRLKLRDIVEKEIEVFVYERPGLTGKEIAQSLGRSYKTVQKYLVSLRKKDRIIAQLKADDVQRFYPNPSVKDKIKDEMERFKELLKLFKE